MGLKLKKYAFSSARKYSAVKWKEKGSFVLGAFEYIFKNQMPKIMKINNALLDAKRVLVFAKVEDIVNGEIIGEPN